MSTLNSGDPLSCLVSMGFDPDRASTALTVCEGNVDNAINFLLTDEPNSDLPHNGDSQALGTRTNAATSSPLTGGQDGSDSIEVVVGSKSQYSYDHGHSACTCIALRVAQGFLTADKPGFAVVTPSFLDRMVEQGVRSYEAAVRSRPPTSSSAGVDHTSVEDVWPQFPRLRLLGGTRQGLLAHDPSHPLGLRTLLRECYSSELTGDTPWICAVLTKPPETVVLCLSSGGYILVDSHPRPQLWPAARQAYAVRHASLEGLVESVERVFPLVDLGSDVPELMQAMYNSFDLSVVAAQTALQPTTS